MPAVTLPIPPTPAPVPTGAALIAAQEAHAKKLAEDAAGAAQNLFNTMRNGVNLGAGKFWADAVAPTDSTPQQRLDALQKVMLAKKSSAKEMFAANAAAVAFLDTVHPGTSATMPALALVKTVTFDPATGAGTVA